MSGPRLTVEQAEKWVRDTQEGTFEQHYALRNLVESLRIESRLTAMTRNQAQYHVERLKLEVLELRQLLGMVVACSNIFEVRTLCSHYGVTL